MLEEEQEPEPVMSKWVAHMLRQPWHWFEATAANTLFYLYIISMVSGNFSYKYLLQN